MLDSLPSFLKAIIDLFTILSGLWLFVVLGPVCFVVERSAKYYLCMTKPYGKPIEKEEKLRRFRRETKEIGLGLALAFLVAFALPDSPNKLLFLYAMPAYYAYTLAIAIEFIWVWFSRHCRR